MFWLSDAYQIVHKVHRLSTSPIFTTLSRIIHVTYDAKEWHMLASTNESSWIISESFHLLPELCRCRNGNPLHLVRHQRSRLIRISLVPQTTCVRTWCHKTISRILLQIVRTYKWPHEMRRGNAHAYVRALTVSDITVLLFDGLGCVDERRWLMHSKS